MHSGGQGERDRRQEQRPAPGQGLLWPGSQLAPKGADYLDFLGTAAPKTFSCHLLFVSPVIPVAARDLPVCLSFRQYHVVLIIVTL